MLTRSMRCDLGVMISASHNPYEDNGIKLFGPDGFKLSDDVELQIEALIDSDLTRRLSGSAALGRAKRIESVQARYIEFAKRTLPRQLDLEGMRVVIDCANGAGYKVAPEALWELGAEVVSIGVEPNGFNINHDVGSTAPDALIHKVRELRADVGIALDGDADRVLIVDEKGHKVDGDQLMGVVARSWKEDGRLAQPGIVATIMSNLGLERFLGGMGLGLVRTAVGDRYVLEHMRAHGFNLGGEQSGHIIMSDYTTTGDGLIAALQLLAVVKRLGQAGLGGLPLLRAPAAGAQERALQVRQAAAGSLGHQGHRGRPRDPRPGGPPRDPSLRHRAGHPRDGRGRQRGPRQPRGRRRGRCGDAGGLEGCRVRDADFFDLKQPSAR